MSNDEFELDLVGRQLRDAMPPWRNCELKTDLWPQMLRRMEETPFRFGWLESAVLGVVVVSFTFFPELIPLMLYHL